MTKPPVPSPMRSRHAVARTTFAVLAALTLLAIVAYASIMLAAPARQVGGEFTVARSGDEYLVYTVPIVPIDNIIHGRWSVSVGNRSPDIMMTVHAEDLPDVLAGRAPAHGAQVTNYSGDASWGGYYNRVSGYVVIEYVHTGGFLNHEYSSPYRCPSCKDDPRVAIVWARGTAWQGTPPSGLQHGAWIADDRGQPQADAPILFGGVANEHNFVDWFPVMYFGLAGLAGLTALAGVWWGVEAWLMRRARGAAAPEPVGSEDLLRLVDMSERYLHAISRWYLAGGVAVVVTVLVVSTLIVPTLLHATRAHFGNAYYDDTDLPILLMGPFVAIILAALWGAGYARVRKERHRWRTLSRDFHATTDRILEP